MTHTRNLLVGEICFHGQKLLGVGSSMELVRLRLCHLARREVQISEINFRMLAVGSSPTSPISQEWEDLSDEDESLDVEADW